MEKNSFYKNGLNFSCKKCSACCGVSPGFVYLSKKDLLSLTSFFKLSIKDFVEKYCRWADYYGGTTVLALKEQKDYYCILWENGCSAYEARPIQCSTYPFWTWMLSSKETWAECALTCPGMNSGALHLPDEINAQSKMYSENEPVLKEDVLKLM